VPSHVQYAAADGPLPVTIFNDPFPGPDNDTGVIAAMQGRNPGPPLTFIAAGPGANMAGYRIILAFDAPAFSRCGAAPPPPSPSPAARPPARTRISAAFCLDNRILSDASADAGAIATPQDPHFARLIQDLLSALLPYYDPSSQNQSGGGSGAM